MTKNIILIMNFIIFLIPGLLYVFMPYLTRRTESFGISVPEEIYNSQRMQKIRKKYVYAAMSVLVFTFLLTLGLYMVLEEPQNMYAYVSGIFFMLFLMFMTYLYFHFYVKRLKKQENWTEGKKQISVVDTSFRNRKLTYSNILFAIPTCLILFSIYFTWQNYESIPDLIPFQYDFEGNPTNLRDKSPLSVFFPNILQTLMLGLFIFINNIIAKAKQQIDPQNPEASILRNEIFRRKWSAFIIVTGGLMVALFSFMQITFIFDVPSSITFIVITGFTVVIIAWAIYLSVTVGQGGSRIKIKDNDNSDEIDREQDRYWKLGQFYYNPEDPAVFIEKRFGIGWTVNFGNKKGWIYITILLLFIIISAFLDI